MLGTVAGGREVLECVLRARDEVTRKQAKTRAALQLIARQFALDLKSVGLQAALQFANEWEKKATTETKELGEWIEYLNYFREAGGVIPLTSKPEQDVVHLMTVHGAKGLEFSHVFILRATSPSFPSSYKESHWWNSPATCGILTPRLAATTRHSTIRKSAAFSTSP